MRVGEPFTVVLTCAVVENETTTVVPDQSRLEPAALQLPPFEVIGGSRGPDLHSDSRRFFQYQYSLRLINEEMFGKDAHIPSVQINYNLESRVGRGEAVRGRDRTYILPSESVRVLSLVPADATDIRDAPSWTFGDIEAQRFRARVFFVAAGVLFAAAALVIVVALLRMMRTLPPGRGDRPPAAVRPRGPARRRPRARRRPAADPGGRLDPRAGRPCAGRDAGRRQRRPRTSGRPGGRRPPASTGHEGQLVMRGGLLRGKKALVSGSATADAVARALATEGGSSGHRQALEEVQLALARFTTALFGRDEKLDDTALGESLSDSFRVVRRLKLENLWLVKKYKGMTQFATEVGNRAWSR